MANPIFSNTLILGASVSAATVDRNPAKRFLRDLGQLAGATSLAQSGQPGANVLPQLKVSRLDQASAVIAVDLFFWDSVMGQAEPRETLAFMRGFFKAVAKRSLPLIVGRIPYFHGIQIYRDELNAAIEREVAQVPSARVLELDRLFEQIKNDDGVRIDGKHHPLSDLIPDGLHPGPVAAEFIAREIARIAETFEPRTGHDIENRD